MKEIPMCAYIGPVNSRWYIYRVTKDIKSITYV